MNSSRPGRNSGVDHELQSYEVLPVSMVKMRLGGVSTPSISCGSMGIQLLPKKL